MSAVGSGASCYSALDALALRVLAPMTTPMVRATALMVVAAGSAHVQPHTGPRVCTDGHGTGRWGVAAGGDAAAAVVGDDLTGVDQVDVAAGHAPLGQRPQAGARGDAAHGVAGADGHAGRVGLRGLLRRYGRGAGEALVDDRHDLVVVRAERVAPLLAVAVVATDGGGRECL